MTTDADAMVILANSIDGLAQAIERFAFPQQYLVSPGGSAASTPPAAGSPSQPLVTHGASTGPPGGPPHTNGEDTSQVKRGKKIYAICRQNDWDIADIGQRVTGHAMNPNSQKWSEADQVRVLDAFKEWGVG